ncbi:tetratricopeptide repeat protein [Flectobacillus rivi]|uniref:Tetratricopeptide repeat protein n=1 Tax=Flectobacillus rivi TaxID=2984209 RepID=A0ABT6Z9C1_9BACT|nr:tetratricopeptide repeat protein [Flectobacillus rivi]MDI9877731.1 tetratricopeptide repeat protein [Flectobacillus rivi]
MSKKNKSPKVETQSPKATSETVITTPSSTSKNTILTIIAFAVVVLLGFSGGFSNQFVDWDDHVYVVENILVTHPSGHWLEAWQSHVASNYHPLTMWSLMLNAVMSGAESARAFIITNTFIHFLNVILVWLLALKLLESYETGERQKKFIAILTALLFAIHPMRVESVIWVSERKDVLYVFFLLLGSLQYFKYVDKGQKVIHLIFAFLLYLASCLSKGQAVIFPLVLFLFDYWRNREFSIKVFVEKIPFFVVSVVFGLIAINIQGGGNLGGMIHPIAATGVAFKPEDISYFKTITYAGYGFMMYWVHLVTPIGLRSMYMYEDPTLFHSEYYLGLVVMLGILGWGIFNIKRNKLIAFGIGFFTVTIILVLQILQVGGAIMADRYTYLPYIGLFFMLAVGISKLIENPKIQQAVWAVCIVWLGILLVITRKQVGTWQNSGTLFSRRIELAPEKDERAYSAAGQYYGAKENNLDLAIAYSEKAIQLGYKIDVTPLGNLASAYERKGDYPKAIEYLTKAIQQFPSADTYLNRGNMYLNAQMPDKALPDLEKALTMPENKRIGVNYGSLATAQLNTNRTEEALKNFNIAIDQYGSQNPEHFYNRGVTHHKLGHWEAAIIDIKRCLQLKPDHPQATQALSLLGVKK